MTIFTDAATISTSTSINSSEVDDFVEAAIINSTTSISSVDIKGYSDAATIATKTSLTSVEVASYVESAVVKSITTPDIIVEIPTTINVYVNLSGSSFVGSILTATITTEVTGGTTGGGGGGGAGTPTDPDAPGYVVTYSPGGQWGTADTDDGVIP